MKFVKIKYLFIQRRNSISKAALSELLIVLAVAIIRSLAVLQVDDFALGISV